MARRSIEMYEYRQALMRMRQGDSEREIARSKLMGRSKAARFRELARAQGWLDPERPLPEDAEIAAALGQPKLPVTAQSSIAAYRPLVEQWLTQGVSGVVIHTTLKREHGFAGHYSSVRRLVAAAQSHVQPRDRAAGYAAAPPEEAVCNALQRPGPEDLDLSQGSCSPARMYRATAWARRGCVPARPSSTPGGRCRICASGSAAPVAAKRSAG